MPNFSLASSASSRHSSRTEQPAQIARAAALGVERVGALPSAGGSGVPGGTVQQLVEGRQVGALHERANLVAVHARRSMRASTRSTSGRYSAAQYRANGKPSS